MTSTNAVFVAIELSKSTWLVAVHTPIDGRIGQHKIAGSNVSALLSIIDRARNRQARTTVSAVSVHCCFEAGYDGFWLARRLSAEQIQPHVIDATSLKVDRRAKRAKTDRIDVGGLLRVIMALHQGDSHACRLVPIPTPEEEDAKRTHRERQRLVKERTGHINRIKGLLATQGIYDYQPLKQDRRRRLPDLRTGDGRELLSAYAARFLVNSTGSNSPSNKSPRSKRNATPPSRRVRPAHEPNAAMGAQLIRLRGVGAETATILVREAFYRSFTNCKALAPMPV